MKNYWKIQYEIDQLFKAPRFRKLRYAAFIVIGLTIATLLATIFWMDSIPYKTMQILRGCVGLGALAFVVLASILAYKVYTEYFTNRYKK